jgi:4-hydroxy-tetrahydrodipicolinate reductase
MIRVLMSGCNGKMGQVITRLANESDQLRIVAGCDINDNIKNDYPVFKNIKDCNVEVDVIIDFSNPSAFDNLIDFATSKKIPLVMATTGLSQENIEKLKVASKDIPIFFSANMSLGINLVLNLVKKAARVLEGNFDIEIIEKHHNQKLDAPSGTALVLADAINSVLQQKYEYTYDRHSRRAKRKTNEIGIHAVRGGTIVGEHSVIFAGNDEIIEINHSAMSKEIFGTGALKAARYIYNKTPGIYSMDDLIQDE